MLNKSITPLATLALLATPSLAAPILQSRTWEHEKKCDKKSYKHPETGKCTKVPDCASTCGSKNTSGLFALISAIMGLKIEAGSVLDLNANTCISVQQCKSDCTKQVFSIALDGLGRTQVCGTKQCGSGEYLVSVVLR